MVIDAERNMKILHISSSFKPAWETGGVAKHVYEISKNLIEKGHEVTVFTTDRGEKRVNIQKNRPVFVDDIRVYYFSNISNYLATKKRKISTPYYLPLIAKKEIKDFDVIHIHGFRSTLSIPIHRYAKKYGVPYVIDPQGSILRIEKQKFKKLFDIFFGYRILRDAYKIIAGSEVEMDEEKCIGVDDEKIVLILPGYDVNSFSDLPEVGQFREKFGIKEKNIILFLGRIHKIKGIDFLVKSFYELTRSRDDVILVIVGPDDGYKSTIKKLINELNLSQKVLFTGFLDGEEKLSAYVDAAIFVQPSKYERFCGSPFEAILCNTPIIVTKNTGCGNFVGKMDMGYTVNYGDINELRSIMEEVLNDLSGAPVKTQRCKHYIINNLTWEKQIEKYEKLYQDAIEGVNGGWL